MNRIPVTLLFAATLGLQATATPDSVCCIADSDSVITVITTRLDLTESKVAALSAQMDVNTTRLDTLAKALAEISHRADSLSGVCQLMEATRTTDRNTIDGRLDRTDESLNAYSEKLRDRTLWGGLAAITLLTAIAFVAYKLTKKSDKGTIDDIRKAQKTIRDAQARMEEESVKLDSQLLSLVEKQMTAVEGEKPAVGQDHSLVVKLADEIARIETNLAKMDKTVKGYKQLVQAKDRMINNVRANGYEIVSLLGQEYNDGMQYQARFVPDDSLPEGKRIITGMIKMQVNYNGKMIQPAEIVVSQNI